MAKVTKIHIFKPFCYLPSNDEAVLVAISVHFLFFVSYVQLTGDLSGKKVGLVTEGFDTCEPDVVALVKDGANKLTQAGAVVEDVSIPMHSVGMSKQTISHYINRDTPMQYKFL